MKELISYTAEILIATCVIFFLWGLGYLITSDMQRRLDFATACLESGNDYIEGSCIK
jgi:hypothetical protein